MFETNFVFFLVDLFQIPKNGKGGRIRVCWACHKESRKSLAKNNSVAGAVALYSMDSLKDHIFVECIKRVKEKVVFYSNKSNCTLKATAPVSTSVPTSD